MRGDRPTATQILEELADKVVAQIERGASVSFQDAFDEMTGYHRFLLGLNAVEQGEQGPFNYAMLAGGEWGPPHEAWIQEYYRLFDRAADKIAENGQFFERLTVTPLRLLPRADEPALPATMVEAILDLGAMATPALEAWRTRRVTVENAMDEAARPRLALAGTDTKAFAGAMMRVVGNWESLLQLGPPVIAWRKAREGDAESVARWARYGDDWAYVRRHLENTALSLTRAVWNEDEIGASLWRDALVRWDRLLEYKLDGRAELRWSRILSPEVLRSSWQDALDGVGPLLFDRMPSPTPEELFRSLLRGAHRDIVLLTASLLVFWTINDKQSSDIGARTASALLRGEVNDRASAFTAPDRQLSFRALFLDCLRLHLVGERFADNGAYGGRLDRLVAQMDRMTERRVVPGRVYTPSTLDEREDLVGAQVAILASLAPAAGDGGVARDVAEIAANPALLPGDDRGLRRILRLLELYRRMLEVPPPRLSEAIDALAGEEGSVENKLERLRTILEAVEQAIGTARTQRLRAAPINKTRIDQIGREIESVVLASPTDVGPFIDVAVQSAICVEPSPPRRAEVGGLAKAHFVDPPMEDPISNLEEMLAQATANISLLEVLADFARRPRQPVPLNPAVSQPAFWREIADFAARVGPAPVLLISRSGEEQALRVWRSMGVERPDGLQIGPINGRAPEGWLAIATVNGVEVFSSDLPAGEALLFSRRLLETLIFTRGADQDGFVVATFEVTDDDRGVFRTEVRPRLKWADRPIYAFRVPSPASEASLQED
ncbi:hypothetical protein CFHF_03780 [Caulobacter flavus]|uniref:Uncharacterized protein n=1 Tax=Caulobacter flavus TaxID=1679497 RepID=A0A2N5CZ99_9CAUL|nr:hypothetical protein [Caulobacter flavus]AYV45181.1 hypothetical protein C1707_02390 [Caulobacter flavus]PLR19139.1 hypothetical protein CFHF_03780 [Caulobacter flavus]